MWHVRVATWLPHSAVAQFQEQLSQKDKEEVYGFLVTLRQSHTQSLLWYPVCWSRRTQVILRFTGRRHRLYYPMEGMSMLHGLKKKKKHVGWNMLCYLSLERTVCHICDNKKIWFGYKIIWISRLISKGFNYKSNIPICSFFLNRVLVCSQQMLASYISLDFFSKIINIFPLSPYFLCGQYNRWVQPIYRTWLQRM